MRLARSAQIFAIGERIRTMIIIGLLDRGVPGVILRILLAIDRDRGCINLRHLFDASNATGEEMLVSSRFIANGVIV